jgi:hypothetical protein
MGSSDFHTFVKRRSKPAGLETYKVERGNQYMRQVYTDWPSAKEAFRSAVDQARYEYGHGGYTGTIAEKGEFVMIGTAPDKQAASQMADDLIDNEDQRINDKWGPAGCIEVTGEDGGWLFFGWASD